MVLVLVALLAQSPPPAAQQVDLPVSLDRVREGLARPGRFDLPRPRPWRRPLFRVSTEGRPFEFENEAWDDTTFTPPWVRPLAPTAHFEFLSAVTPEESRSPTVHPCCNVTPVVGVIAGLVKDGVRAAKERSARREVERAMREAGIKR